MSTNNGAEALSRLLAQAEKQGYLTVDDIIDCVDSLDLPIQVVDWITSTLTTRSVLIYDTVPTKVSTLDDDDEEYKDYAQSDYEKLYDEIIRTAPSLEAFINQVRTIVPPQYKEITHLKYQVAEGNEYARKRMIEMQLRQAIRLAYQRSKAYDLDLEESISTACMALIIAVDQYKPDENGTFGGFAAYRILRIMEREQPTKRPLIYYPVHKQTGYIASYQILKSFGCVECPSINECEKIKTMIRKQYPDCSESDPVDIINQCIPLESFDDIIENIQVSSYEMHGKEIPYDDAVDMFFYPFLVDYEDIPFEIAAEESLKEQVRAVLCTIPPREAEVLKLRCGIDCKEPLTLEEVGELFEVTRERIRQIEAKALRRLRHPKRAKILDGYIEKTLKERNNPEEEQQEIGKKKRKRRRKEKLL